VDEEQVFPSFAAKSPVRDELINSPVGVALADDHTLMEQRVEDGLT